MLRYFEYGSIALCAAACWLIFFLRRRLAPFRRLAPSDRLMIPAALAATLSADTFLVLLLNNDLAGVLLFCLVQTIYARLISIRLKRQESTGKRPLAAASRMARIAALLIIILILLAYQAADLLTLASAYSMAMLIMNAVFSAAAAGREKGSPAHPAYRLFALGLALFFGCDACVGLYNAPRYLPGFPQWVSHTAYVLIWLFYLPAQILIVLSYEKTARSAESAAKQP